MPRSESLSKSKNQSCGAEVPPVTATPSSRPNMKFWNGRNKKECTGRSIVKGPWLSRIYILYYNSP